MVDASFSGAFDVLRRIAEIEGSRLRLVEDFDTRCRLEADVLDALEVDRLDLEGVGKENPKSTLFTLRLLALSANLPNFEIALT